jgi:hypothetical protein
VTENNFEQMHGVFVKFFLFLDFNGVYIFEGVKAGKMPSPSGEMNDIVSSTKSKRGMLQNL